MRKIGTILPKGNEDEFEHIRAELRARNIVWFEREVQGDNGRIFWFFESELVKLPADAESQGNNEFPYYLPVDAESGHSVSVLDRYLEINPGQDTQSSL